MIPLLFGTVVCFKLLLFYSCTQGALSQKHWEIPLEQNTGVTEGGMRGNEKD